MSTAWYALPPEPRLITCPHPEDDSCHCTAGAMTWKPGDEAPAFSWLGVPTSTDEGAAA